MKRLHYALAIWIVLASSFYAQNQISEADVKSQLTTIFDLSKQQNFGAASKLLLYNENNELRNYNFENSNEAKNVKRMVKKIKAYLDLSDSYEYETLTYLNDKSLPTAEIKINFKSGDQKLTISFSFVKFKGNLLLESFK
jgi:hypothetical protein